MTTPSLRSRILLVDLLKAVAAQFIVLHHLAWYGPLSDQAVLLAPWVATLKGWLAEYGRYAVAVFFVTGGFLAAQTLSPRGLGPGNAPGCLIRDRYFRLILPFAVALLLAIIASALARQWMLHESIGSPPNFLQILAHLTLLHTLLGIESLSAGVWYVAIDFQLYALLVLLLWLGQRIYSHPASAEFARAIPILVFALLSLFYFNREARWDATALFFFGAYALGIGSGWAIRSGNRNRLLWLIAIVAGLSLWVNFRPRIALATLTALALGCSRLHMTRFEMKYLHYFGGTSYALFLVHFPVCLLVNAGFQHFTSATPAISAWGLLVAWLASNLAADLFHRHVELPLARWQKRRMQCRARLKTPAPKTPFKPA
jgi:peptidoglycan/LPS O-acetylase OafA/YrhL